MPSLSGSETFERWYRRKIVYPTNQGKGNDRIADVLVNTSRKSLAVMGQRFDVPTDWGAASLLHSVWCLVFEFKNASR